MRKQFFDFLQEWPNLEAKLNFAAQQISQWLIDSYGISREQQAHWVAQATDQSFSNAFSVLKQTISFSAFSFVMLILIPVYVVLILFYRNLWVAVLFRIFPHQENIKELLFLTIQAYYNFIKGMGLVYLAVGVLNSVGLLLLGVPHAILFGCIASVLTFIPYIGIMAGSLLPIAMAWITYDSIWLFIDVRTAVHGELFNTGRERNRTTDQGAGAARGVRDIAGRLVEDAMVKCFQADANILRFHGLTQFQFLPISKSEKQPARHPRGSRDSCFEFL